MENRRKPKSVEEIIQKYGVQSISTDAKNNANDDGFMQPAAKPPRKGTPSPKAQPPKTKEKFTVTIPGDEPETVEASQDTAEIEDDFVREMRRDVEAELAKNAPADSDKDSLDSFFIPDTAFYIGSEDENNKQREIPDWVKNPINQDDFDDYADGQESNDNIFMRIVKFIVPWKGDSAGEIIRKILFFVALIVLIVSASVLFSSKIEDSHASQTDAAVSDLYHNSDEADIEEAEKILGGELPGGILPEFAMLYAQNQDVVGWLTINGTKVDYPIARAQDNDYYFHRNYYKEKTRYGVPFMDYRCGHDPLSTNTVIYGHHMNNGTVFSGLDAYKNLDGYKQHPVINFNTIYERHEWQVFAAFITNSYKDDDGGYFFDYMVPEFAGEDDFNGFVHAVKRRSLFNTNVDVTYGDKLLTLQTCSHEFDGARLVVVARMVKEGDPQVDVNSATVNPNPVYPWVYCNKYGVSYNFEPEDHWVSALSGGQEPSTTQSTEEVTTTAETTTAVTTTAAQTTSTTKATTTTRPTTTTTRPTTTTTRPTTTTTRPTTTTTTKPTTTTTKPTTTTEPETTTKQHTTEPTEEHTTAGEEED